MSEAAAVREMVSTRDFDVPREAVFAAFADAAALASWWGPAGFTSEFHVFDCRSGGVWRFAMRAPDGAEYPMDHRFLEVVAPERIVFRHLQPGHDYTATIELAAMPAGTRLTWRMVFDSAAEAARVRDFIQAANEENLDRLEAYLHRAP